ncbi:fibronectin type III domain-containing protein [Candidatus Daviesbacteria bacterium]|nr:fibronectin type III domain-containing protein [Candidatus Daviesbacteria bacterium]
MISFINKFKIPTLLGLSIIFLGLFSGVYLVLKEQIFFSKAASDATAQNITLTNITEDSATISWQTNSPTSSFITFGQDNPNQSTSLDDRDNDSVNNTGPTARLFHYVTLKNLLPKTIYQFKIISGKTISAVNKFQTAGPTNNVSPFAPVIGSILDETTSLNNGIIYLSIGEAITQSSLVKSGGNFLLPLSRVRKADLSDLYQITEGEAAKLTIYTDKGQTTVLFKLKANTPPLPTIRLGENLDLTNEKEPAGKYDLNNDGIVNSADYAILSSCLGKEPTDMLAGDKPCSKADINTDGSIDNKDQNLMLPRN